MTATRKNVNEDIRDARRNTHMHREDPEECENRPGQCSIEGRKTIKPTDVELLAAFFFFFFFWAAHQAAGVKNPAQNRAALTLSQSYSVTP